MANDPGAYWDVGLWDLSKWDTVAANGGWTGGPDVWASSIHIISTYSGQINELPDVWDSTVRVFDAYSINVLEDKDIWEATVEVHAPTTSYVNENPDIWNALIYATLHPPIYGAGGGWGWHWFSDFPEYNSKSDLSKAYDNWRYKVDASVSGNSDSWGGRVDSYSLPAARVKAQVELMFGSTTFVDWDEEAIIEELLS